MTYADQMDATDHRWARGGRFLAVATVGMVTAGLGVFVGLGRVTDLWEAWVIHNALAGVGLAVVLWLVARAEPRNPVVWIVALVTVMSGVQVLAAGVVVGLLDAAGVRGSPQALAPAALDTTTAIISWFNAWSWVLIVVPAATFLPLHFPNGHLPGPQWRVVAWLSLGALVLVTLGMMAAAWPTSTVPVADAMAAPSGIASAALFGYPLLLVAAAASVSSMVHRARRASGPQRQQIRWAGFGAGVFALVTGFSYLFDPSGEVFKVVVIPGLAALLGGLAIAILRYRLYEIDRIVSRTVTYGLVTAVLVGVYALVAVVPAALFDLQSDLLVAGATLVAAAAFGPVRRRVQAVVDRRFNRTRYDAEQVADRFGARLRDEVDLDGLTTDLREVVAATVQPVHVSLWLRKDAW